MSEAGPDPARGRLFLVTGPDAAERLAVASSVARALDRCALVDGAQVDRMLVSGRVPVGGPLTGELLGQLLLRWSASIAAAETFLLEGYDAVVSDDVQGDRLEDFLDLAAPRDGAPGGAAAPGAGGGHPALGSLGRGRRPPARAGRCRRPEPPRRRPGRHRRAGLRQPAQDRATPPVPRHTHTGGSGPRGWLDPVAVAATSCTSRTGRKRAGRTRRGRSSATCGP